MPTAQSGNLRHVRVNGVQGALYARHTVQRFALRGAGKHGQHGA
jgi:hypothetical protein